VVIEVDHLHISHHATADLDSTLMECIAETALLDVNSVVLTWMALSVTIVKTDWFYGVYRLCVMTSYHFTTQEVMGIIIQNLRTMMSLQAMAISLILSSMSLKMIARFTNGLALIILFVFMVVRSKAREKSKSL